MPTCGDTRERERTGAGAPEGASASAVAAPPPRREGPPDRWRVLVDAPGSGAANMALDHALARERAPGAGTLRVYGWSRPTVSFGRNEPARGLYDLERARSRGVGFVRRPTGGRAVLHDRELTYALVAPVRAWGGLRDAYRNINRGLVRGLRRLGVTAELAPPLAGRQPPPSAGPCFRLPAEGEVTADGRKLVGSAQARVGRTLLQHGSLLLDGGQDRLARIRPGAAAGRETPAGGGASPATLREILGRLPERAEIVEALVAGLGEALGGRWEWGEPSERERRSACELVEERYASEEWTWRR